MRQRLISAAVLVPVVVIVFLLGDPWLTIGIALVSGVAAFEASRLLGNAGVPATPWPAVVVALGVVLLGYLLALSSSFDTLGVSAFVLLLATGIAVLLAIRERGLSGTSAVPGTVAAALYGGQLVFVVFLLAAAPAVPPSSAFARVFDAGRVWLLILVLTVWTLDTCAYLVGRAFPIGRMAPRISPRKTWSGAVGGTVAAMVVCAALLEAVDQDPVGGALLGLAIAVAAQAGDLVESLLKRLAGVKDSGALIPGHGGLLDRVDSFLVAAPAVFLIIIGTRLIAVSRPA